MAGRRMMRRRRPAGRRYKRASPRRRVLKGNSYAKNPMSLLGLQRHYNGATGGRKSDGFIQYFDNYEQPTYKKFGRAYFKTLGRATEALGHYTGLPFAEKLNDLGEYIGNYISPDIDPSSFPKKEGKLRVIYPKSKPSDSRFETGNRFIDANLDSLDGENRSGLINNYFDPMRALSKSLTPSNRKLISELPNKAQDFYNDYYPSISDGIDNARLLGDFALQNMKYYTETPRKVSDFAPEMEELFSLLSPLSSPPKDKRNSPDHFFEESYDRFEPVSPFKSAKYTKVDQVPIDLDQSGTGFTPMKPKPKTIKLPSPVKESRFVGGRNFTFSPVKRRDGPGYVLPPIIVKDTPRQYTREDPYDLPPLMDKYGRIIPNSHYLPK